MPTMNRETSKLYLVFGLLFLIACIVAFIFLFDQPGIIGAIAFLFLVAAPLTLIGFLGYRKGDRSERAKSRDAAMILSFLPFLGHRYLGVQKRGLPMMVLLVISVSFFVTAALIIVDEKGDNSAEAGGSLIFFGMMILILSWMWSAIDVNEICNSIGLPHEGGFFEMRLARTDLALSALFLTVFFFCIIISLFLLNEGWIDEMYFWISVTLSALLPLYVTLHYAKKRFKLSR